MKKMLLTAILAMAVLAASCGGTDGSELVEKYSDTEGVVQTVAVETPWLSAETEYSPDSDDSYDGIFSMKQSSALVTEDRIYFSKKIYHDDSDNHDKSYVYVSRKTGECASLCPDPLCAHTEGSGCRYLDLMQLIPDSGNSSVLYAMKQEFTEAGMKCSICRVDTENDTITELYADGSTFLTLKFISGGRLYFTTVLYERTKNPNGTISKNVVESFRALSLTDGGVDVIENGYSDRSHGEPFWSDGERVYFIEGSSRLFCTDMSFENERTLFEVSGEYQIISLYFDAETSEIWLCARTLFMNGLSDDGLIDGGIYRVDLDGEARRVAVPSDRVMDFVLTRKNIYYTSYDKKEYGESPRGGVCERYDGDCLYMVSREAAENAEYGDASALAVETVFDGHETLFATKWIPADGYIYLSAEKLMDVGDMNWFRVIGETARVSRNGTIKWMAIK